jgi:hypothetical protein
MLKLILSFFHRIIITTRFVSRPYNFKLITETINAATHLFLYYKQKEINVETGYSPFFQANESTLPLLDVTH